MYSIDIIKFLNNFKERVPYPSFSKLYKEFAITKELNKDKIDGDKRTYSDKINILKKVSDKSNYAVFFKSMISLYKANIEYGSKYVQYFKITPFSSDGLFQELDSLLPSKNKFSSSYPLLLDKTDFDDVIPGSLSLVNKRKNENEIILVFSRLVHFQERVSIKSSSIIDSDLKDMYTEFYGIRHYLKQYIDLVVFNTKTNVLEIRIDHFTTSSDSQSQKQFHNFLKQFKERLSPKFNKLFLANKLNIHPVIKSINDDKACRVVEISFSTKEGSNIKIKRRQKDSDIRTEAYHKAGSAAVLDNLDIYRIAAFWNRAGDEVELLIPGSSKMINDSYKEINEAIITKCNSIEDFNFVNSKLFSYISDNVNN